MSTLVENVQKVKNAHAALKTAIAAKGVDVPDGTKLTDMPALVEQIPTEPVPTNPRAVFAFDSGVYSITVPAVMTVDFTTTKYVDYCFYNDYNLTSLTLPEGFGQNAKYVGNCFYYCSRLKSISIPEGFGQKAVAVNSCFAGCKALTSLTLPEGFGQVATNCGNCFNYCSSLTTLTLPEGFGRKATGLGNCFSYCSSLTTLTLPEGFGLNATSLGYCFGQCQALTNITGNPNFKVSVDFSFSTNLTHDSLMVIINGLQTVTSTQTLTLGSTNLAKLTEADKQIATDKGWTLA